MTNIGNKAPGGLDETEVDIRVQALTQAASLQANIGQLARVDTGVFEVVQTGVEYWPPSPYNLYGAKARARRFTNATGASGLEVELIASGVVNAIGWIGSSLESATGYVAVLGSAHNDTYGVGLTVKNTGALTFQRGSNSDDVGDTWDFIAFYVIA